MCLSRADIRPLSGPLGGGIQMAESVPTGFYPHLLRRSGCGPVPGGRVTLRQLIQSIQQFMRFSPSLHIPSRGSSAL